VGSILFKNGKAQKPNYSTDSRGKKLCTFYFVMATWLSMSLALLWTSSVKK